LLGPTVDTVIDDYNEMEEELDPETIFRMSEQLLKAIEFIHRAGMARMGHVGNVKLYRLFSLFIFIHSDIVFNDSPCLHSHSDRYKQEQCRLHL
jgi:hypothetical protein